MMFFEVFPAGEFAVVTVINTNLINIEDTPRNKPLKEN